ncbi:MAG: aspartate/glutamate racemase family protein [Sediminispirochaetaceae bacterium]
MRILVLNPNTSRLVTEKIEKVIRKVARKDVEVVVDCLEHGPEVLESYYDEARATPYSIEKVQQANRDGFDAVIIAAFCDPGIEALKEISDIPVYGTEEAAFSAALLLGNKFAILTEKKQKESVKAQHVRKLGLESRFANVRALGMGVVEIAEDERKVIERAIELSRLMIDEDKAEVIIMGCASMAGYSAELEEKLQVPILDPVSVAYKMVEGLTELGIRHSKIGLFARPAEQKWS